MLGDVLLSVIAVSGDNSEGCSVVSEVGLVVAVSSDDERLLSDDPLSFRREDRVRRAVVAGVDGSASGSELGDDRLVDDDVLLSDVALLSSGCR